jgi:protein TonB
MILCALFISEALTAQTVKLPTKKSNKTEKAEKQEKADKKADTKAEKTEAAPVSAQPQNGSMTLPTVKKDPAKTATPEPAKTADAETAPVKPVPQANGTLGALPVTVRHREVPRATPTIPKKPKKEDNQIYESAEHMPTYPGGVQELMNFIQEHMQYPESALNDGLEDIIQVSFIVEKDGTPKEFEVIDQHDPALEAEAVRILEQMPKWKPATHNGVKVRVEYVVPVKFKLPNQ